MKGPLYKCVGVDQPLNLITLLWIVQYKCAGELYDIRVTDLHKGMRVCFQARKGMMPFVRHPFVCTAGYCVL